MTKSIQTKSRKFKMVLVGTLIFGLYPLVSILHAQGANTHVYPNDANISSANISKDNTETDNQNSKEKNVMDIVSKAKKYIEEEGKDNALVEFNKPDGQFSSGESYVFAVDNKGTFLADSNNPEMIGSKQINLKDSNENLVVQKLIEKAKSGGGWIVYQWKNPLTNQLQCKKSYLMPILTEKKSGPLPIGYGFGNDYFIGAGYYITNSDGKCE